MDDDSTLARLLAAAAAPAHPDELDREEAALAAFRQQLAARNPAGRWRSSPGGEHEHERVPEPARGYVHRRERGAWRWSRVIPASAAVAVIATGVGLLGTQLVGAARTSRHTGVSVTAPASHPAGRSPSSRQSTAAAPTPSASPRQGSAAASSAVRSTPHGPGANSGKHNGSQGHGRGNKKSGKTGGAANGKGNANGNGNGNGQNGGKGKRGR